MSVVPSVFNNQNYFVVWVLMFLKALNYYPFKKQSWGGYIGIKRSQNKKHPRKSDKIIWLSFTIMVVKTFETWFQTRSEADLITSKPKRRNLFHLHLAYSRARLTTCNTNSSLKNVSQNHWLEKQPKPQASFSSYSNWECFFFFFFLTHLPQFQPSVPQSAHT